MEDQYCTKWETDSFQFVVTYLFEKAERVTTLKDLYQTINLANRYDLGVFEDRLLDELEKAEARIRAMMAIEEKEKKETKVAILLIRRISVGQIVNPNEFPIRLEKGHPLFVFPIMMGKKGGAKALATSPLSLGRLVSEGYRIPNPVITPKGWVRNGPA